MFLAPGSPPSSCSVFLYPLFPRLLVRCARRIFASSTEIYNKNMELRRDSQACLNHSNWWTCVEKIAKLQYDGFHYSSTEIMARFNRGYADGELIRYGSWLWRCGTHWL
ncbi:uncharacterized protein [Zea mays]|uniref:Uncharacterized protein n=1 Tax=Zea mays TaxID=4577 RepID=A0A804N2H5_MAIZE|nr:uncharacterized protein LOC108961162 [Zea mays]XP_020405633.1 uncharacterized protein LOC108961162 isoform X1 [Zea mays]|eukprot:NP_001333740.1 uncharacterized protein LOC108961162 [Zea mays]